MRSEATRKIWKSQEGFLSNLFLVCFFGVFLSVFCVPAGATANRVALFRRAIRGGVLGGFYQFWFFRCLLFCCFSVGLKTFDCSFAFDLSELIAPLGLHARRTRLFSYALLNSVELAGHRRLPARR